MLILWGRGFLTPGRKLGAIANVVLPKSKHGDANEALTFSVGQQSLQATSQDGGIEEAPCRWMGGYIYIYNYDYKRYFITLSFFTPAPLEFRGFGSDFLQRLPSLPFLVGSF